eukprot:TRINITY_DN2997_c0_g2_i1.p1 TRINITY_DN2997_c0_g2~~TRINITY_DN2997_c0_g2_i1.p1  ORF type:complete len:460 (+),score=120.00 TRINITY_DN2997_c0_g2_i1:614-1993(+)
MSKRSSPNSVKPNSSDEDFEEDRSEARAVKKPRKTSEHDDVEDMVRYSTGVWAEVFIDSEQKWMHVDAFFNVLNRPRSCDPSSNPCFYFIAGEDNKLVDVTKRYAERWSTVLRKRVFDQQMVSEMTFDVGGAFYGFFNLNERERERLEAEEKDLEKIVNSETIPNTLEAFRNHPLYAIEKFLKKYEEIYPKKPVLGQIGKFKIYPRENVHTLHTEDRWIREGRQVKQDEIPFKVVKARATPTSKRKRDVEEVLHGDTGGGTVKEAELFGIWQTNPWSPPAAENGIVPKNERGNVDLWSDAHLPPGTVHLNLPRVVGIARKLGIDFATAMVGFEMKQRRWVPVLDGIVVCKEFEAIVRDAWEEAESKRIERENEKRLERVSQGWKKLVKSVWGYCTILGQEFMRKQQEEVRLRKVIERQEAAATHEHSFVTVKQSGEGDGDLVDVRECEICGLRIETEDF